MVSSGYRYIISRECRRLKEELKYGETLYYVFMKLDAALYYLHDIAESEDDYREIGKELIMCVENEILPIMANYTEEEILEHLAKPQFTNIKMFRDLIIEFMRRSRAVPAKAITQKYPGPPPGWGTYEVKVEKPSRVAEGIKKFFYMPREGLSIKQLILIGSIVVVIGLLLFFALFK